MNRYESAKEMYAKLGVDTDAAIETCMEVPVSLHCWQGDDVMGFDHDGPLTRRHSDDRKLSGKGKESPGAACRYGSGYEPDAGKEKNQCTCMLCNV